MLVYRSVKGANLIATEVDNNFHDLDDRITFIEDNPPVAKSIDEITAEGSTLIILYTDSTEDVVSFPVIALRGRGDWAPSTNYLVNDAVQANGVVYVVQYAHTSDPTFDAGKNDGNGHDAYGPLFNIPESALPAGGDDGFVLAKVSDSDFDFQWVNSAVPAGGTTGQVLRKVTSDDYDVEWAPTPAPPVVLVETSTMTLLDLDYANRYYRCTYSGGCLVTIPADTFVDFPIGTEVHFRQCALGAVELVGEENSDSDGVVLLNPEFDEEGVQLDTATSRKGGVIVAKKVDVNEWDVFGACRASSV